MLTSLLSLPCLSLVNDPTRYRAPPHVNEPELDDVARPSLTSLGARQRAIARRRARARRRACARQRAAIHPRLNSPVWLDGRTGQPLCQPLAAFSAAFTARTSCAPRRASVGRAPRRRRRSLAGTRGECESSDRGTLQEFGLVDVAIGTVDRSKSWDLYLRCCACRPPPAQTPRRSRRRAPACSARRRAL